MVLAETSDVAKWMQEFWQDAILPTLCDYIRIPNQSPAFDPEWQRNGLLDQAVDLVANWVRQRALTGVVVEVVRLPGRTPLLLIEAPGDAEGTVLLYGHVDKQPPFEGWEAGLDPFRPVIRGERLYGRGSADDGYAAFAVAAALEYMAAHRLPRPRCVVMIEACEESGSGDLPAYLELLHDRIGVPDLVVALDSGCGDYERLWVTVSLRGLVNGVLSVAVLEHGIHSGAASGVVPSSFRIARTLLSRVEDERSGDILLRELWAPIPDERRAEAEQMAAVLGPKFLEGIPFLPGVQPVREDLAELLLNRTWRPQLEVTGAAGLPAPGSAGNVLRPVTQLKLSFRLPPGVDGEVAAQHLKAALEDSPPYGAHVRFDFLEAATGWSAPPWNERLSRCVRQASERYFGLPPCFMGEGGTIPFMAILGRMFPAAQFLVTGVLGPHSNAHGPNEFLHLPTAWRLSAVLVDVLQHIAGGSSFE
ncbi:MAG: succinyl-diaminopimelate desuccinylase [Candidatus Binatia bacterium]|nr:MAG: succinyl-diaminopimelate desuccinylase [Candidatus Binatia bacterium]